MTVLQNYKAIIFDWDGTLVNSEDWVVNAHNHVRKAFDLPLWTKADIFSSSSLSARELYPQILGDKSDEALNMLIEYTTKHNLKSAIPYDGAKTLLDLIKDNNVLQGVVSNKRHEPLNEAAKYLNWQNYFSVIIGAGYVSKDKPSAEPLLAAIKEIDAVLTPKDILYVGDTETDLLCAKNTGCDAALIQSGGSRSRPDLIEKYSPAYSCGNIQEFIDILTFEETAENKAC